MTDLELKELLLETGHEDGIKILDNLSEAFVGESCHDYKLVYDSDKIIEINPDFDFSNDGYYFMSSNLEWLDEELVVFSEGFTKAAIIGVTDTSKVVYDYDKLCECYAKAFSEDDGFVYEQLDEDKRSDYYTDGVEWVDYNTIRSLPYDLMNGKPMPIVIRSYEGYIK